MRISQIIPKDRHGFLEYGIHDRITAFTPFREATLPFPVLQAHQVHGDRIETIRSYDTTREDLQGVDGLMTDLPGLAIAARTADCIPVLMYDPVRNAVAAIHSGWKGTVRKISGKAVRLMTGTYGSCPADLLAVIGPGIGPESFQVGPEVAQAFSEAGFPMELILSDRGPKIPGTMRGGLHIDLWKANLWILLQSGLSENNILVSGIDTYACPELFSARREGPACGRIVNTIRIRP